MEEDGQDHERDDLNENEGDHRDRFGEDEGEDHRGLDLWRGGRISRQGLNAGVPDDRDHKGRPERANHQNEDDREGFQRSTRTSSSFRSTRATPCRMGRYFPSTEMRPAFNRLIIGP